MTVMPLSLSEIFVGIGALAAGIGIFRAGVALGRSAGRFTEAFENAVCSHLEGQNRLIEIAEKGMGILPRIEDLNDGQAQMHRTMRAMSRKLNRLTGDFSEDPEAK